MPVKLDRALEQVMERISAMGVMAERMLDNVMLALTKRDLAPLKSVYEDESMMDMMQREIDDETVEMIGVYTPVASDLRVILMSARVNGEIERIGDQVVNMAHVIEKMATYGYPAIPEDLPKMCETSRDILRKSIQAFTRNSSDQSRALIKKDDQIDSAFDKLSANLMDRMTCEAGNSRALLGLLTIARSIERIGDHAVNIAEDTIYAVTGKDIRHMHLDEEAKK